MIVCAKLTAKKSILTDIAFYSLAPLVMFKIMSIKTMANIIVKTMKVEVRNVAD